jgi:CheY-like chemotaxis protein
VRVLLAEDDDTNRAVFRRLLERLGAEVEAASDGAQALALFRDPGRFDFVFLDLGMPGMDGLETARAMRDVEVAAHRAHAPIIALSGAEEDEALARAGFDGMIQKPVGLAGLKAALERWGPRVGA